MKTNRFLFGRSKIEDDFEVGEEVSEEIQAR